ncbi:uncharacterized protein [Parasteatoda tepidariorum]|uniref:uncharacterized protein n=1 Tax=Parasteatoda tepidariorum TaxID=114398 RepID=UPI0039BCFD12
MKIIIRSSLIIFLLLVIKTTLTDGIKGTSTNISELQPTPTVVISTTTTDDPQPGSSAVPVYYVSDSSEDDQPPRKQMRLDLPLPTDIEIQPPLENSSGLSPEVETLDDFYMRLFPDLVPSISGYNDYEMETDAHPELENAAAFGYFPEENALVDLCNRCFSDLLPSIGEYNDYPSSINAQIHPPLEHDIASVIELEDDDYSIGDYYSGSCLMDISPSAAGRSEISTDFLETFPVEITLEDSDPESQNDRAVSESFINQDDDSDVSTRAVMSDSESMSRSRCRHRREFQRSLIRYGRHENLCDSDSD